MNRTRLLMIGFVALAFGAFAGLLVYRNLKSASNANVPAGDPVVVAATDIPLGAKIEAKDVTTVRIPKASLPPRYYADPVKVVGRGVVQQISKGDYVLPNKLAGENAGSGLPALIPPGMLAVSVRVNEVIGVAGFVQPGTRVDVLVTGASAGGEQQTITVLRNVAVIAAGQRLERSSTGESQNTPVITLLVSPDDAQKLALASNEGRIQLALRNPLDTRQDQIPATGTRDLYRAGSAPAPPPRKAVPVKRPLTAPIPQAPAYQIEIYHGNKKDTKTFQGQD